ncbi:MAG: DUF4440 domain-containing protein [candidate division Zixibacteria bacterium]|nr:DUF4440 domain-containing protein [candidate division Zixibacteria bacterium]MDH3936492.1 DUF4440 domain-containing protein [candidate division Zixibacteria bacterium]MDH4032874.1 DUF4440 domain-containing protein [candidate division Zixibacteria bacterium]
MPTIKKSHVGLSLVTLATALIVFFSLSFGDEGNKEYSDDAKNIMNLEKQWSAKFSEGALDWIVSLHTEDAIQFPPGADLIQGKEALRKAWAGMINTEGFEASWESAEVFVSKSGDLAYDYGSLKITNPDGSKANAKYVVVWSKVNGEWKVAADMFNMNGN